MSRLLHRHWESDLSAPSRAARRPCEYDAYLPDALVGRTIALDGPVAADVADAERAIAGLDATAAGLTDTEALARILLRAESVASSKIEGLEVGPRRLLRAEAARELGAHVGDVTAEEILGNIDAMVYAIEDIKIGDTIKLDTVLDIHRRLLSKTRLADEAGMVREVQNWIGGNDYNPCSSSFVPPPAEMVPDLLADLVAFCNEDSLPAVVQAAIAHAQFETIHPFVDGNGRTGRALIHVIFRRRGLATRVNPPVSLILATWARDYVNGLSGTRYLGDPQSDAARDGINAWVARFAGACVRAVADAASFEQHIAEIQHDWRQTLGTVRANSATDRLLRVLVGAPVITVSSAATIIGRSFVQTNEAVQRLADAGILSQINIGRRNRAFEAREIVDAFSDLERQLASPEGDTLVSSPSRRVPRRRSSR